MPGNGCFNCLLMMMIIIIKVNRFDYNHHQCIIEPCFLGGNNVKVSKEQVRENRMRVVETASKLFVSAATMESEYLS